MLDEEIIRFWGEHSLVRWPPDLLTKTGLSEPAKEFLTKVGLPRGADWTAQFDHTLDEMRRSVADARYVVVGDDTGFPFCLDLRTGGQVVIIEADERGRYVNSDVRKFGEFLLLFQRYRLTVRSMDQEQEIQRLISETERGMRASDPTAFSNPACYWPLVLAQMREGSL